MKRLNFILMLLLISGFTKIHAQEQIENIIEKKLESIVENSDENIDITELFDQLLALTYNPINLNHSRISILLENNLINERQFQSLMAYKNLVGKIQSVQEVQFIDGFNKKILQSLEPFIYAGEVKKVIHSLGDLIKYGRNQLFIRYQQVLQKKAAYSDVEQAELLQNPSKFYLGSPAKIYSRYKFSSANRLSAGFVLEKDAGEVLLSNKYKDLSNQLSLKIPAIDFSSFHLSLSNTGIIQKFVLGDYHLQFAQGLTMWSNFAFNKSADVTSVKRVNRNIIPSTSSIENNFFRGMALSLSKGSLAAFFFYSNKERDANLIKESEEVEEISFSSLQNSGLHRNINELEDRNSINEQVYGTRLTFKSNTFELGSTIYTSKYSASLTPSDRVYKKFDFYGSNNACIGFDYQLNLGALNLYGEYSLSKNKGQAYLIGINFYLDSYSKISLLNRDFQPNYQNLYANAFAENAYAKNEKGIYLGFDSWIFPKWQIQTYLDVFKFPWLKSTSDAPSKGIDFFAQINHNPNEQIKIYLKYKRKNKSINSSVPSWTNQLICESKENLRLDLTYDLNSTFKLRSRAEWINFNNENTQKEQGILTFQQLTYSSPNEKLNLHLRFTSFKTDGYNSRIYTYENDVLYSFSIPAFYDIGNHAYLLLKYQFNHSISCWMKFGHSFYRNRESIGSGPEEINGSGKSELKLQVRIQF